MLNREAANNNLIVFGLTPPGLKPINIFHLSYTLFGPFLIHDLSRGL